MKFSQIKDRDFVSVLRYVMRLSWEHAERHKTDCTSAHMFSKWEEKFFKAWEFRYSDSLDESPRAHTILQEGIDMFTAIKPPYTVPEDKKLFFKS